MRRNEEFIMLLITHADLNIVDFTYKHSAFVNSKNEGRVKEWRVTVGIALAVSTVSSFVPV
jgi:hypothetical protein